MAQPKGHGIWWLIPGAVLALAVLKQMAQSHSAGEALLIPAVLLFGFFLPVVMIYKAIQWAQSSGSKRTGQSQ